MLSLLTLKTLATEWLEYREIYCNNYDDSLKCSSFREVVLQSGISIMWKKNYKL